MTENQSLKHKAVSGVLWRIGEQGANQLVSLVISIILARLIMPDQFGMVAMLAVFTAVAGVFIDSGFSSALIRKNDRTQEDCSTVYWFNIVVAVVCYVLLFICAPLVARFYDMPELASILRVTSLGLVIGSLTGVQRTLLSAEMNFKALTKFNVLGVVVSGVVGVTLAYFDFKVWALVFQSLTSTLVGSVCVWFKVKWRPSMVFSKESFREFFGFGSKLLGSRLLDTVYVNLYSIIIGKVYRSADLAFYNRASALTQMTSAMPTGILQSVTYPTLCKLQHSDEALKNGYRRTLRLAAFVIFPLCLGLGAVAYPLINVLYTEKWIYAASLLSIIVFSLMWYPIHAINLNYLVVKGRSDLFLRLEIIKKIQGVIMLCVTVPMGLEAMCYGNVVTSLVSLVWNTHYNGKFLGMGIIAQMRDLFPILLLSGVMFAAARITANAIGTDLVALACSIAIGAIVYIGGAFLFRFPELIELKNIRR